MTQTQLRNGQLIWHVRCECMPPILRIFQHYITNTRISFFEKSVKAAVQDDGRPPGALAFFKKSVETETAVADYGRPPGELVLKKLFE